MSQPRTSGPPIFSTPYEFAAATKEYNSPFKHPNQLPETSSTSTSSPIETPATIYSQPPSYPSPNYCNNNLNMYEHHQSSKPSMSPFDWEYPFISKGVKPAPDKLDSKMHLNSGNYTPENRWQSTSFYERENIWGEIRLYSEHLRRYASEVPHPEVTREKFFEIYNLAVGLLRAIDCLDPDYKMRKIEQPLPYHPYPPSASEAADYMPRRSTIELRREYPPFQNFPPYNEAPPLFYQQIQPYQQIPLQNQMQIPMKNFTGEVFFDDVVESDRYPKRKRKKPLYSVNRNLYCHICFVRETPEWRRGPDGDHTLCNACGLHYAKNQKKEKLAREGRKYSIDMLLCENNSSNANNNLTNNSNNNPNSNPNNNPNSNSNSNPNNNPNNNSNSNSAEPTSSNSNANSSPVSTPQSPLNPPLSLAPCSITPSSSTNPTTNIPLISNPPNSEDTEDTQTEASNQSPTSPRKSFDNSRYTFKLEKRTPSPDT
jgi:hypothetical protein